MNGVGASSVEETRDRKWRKGKRRRRDGRQRMREERKKLRQGVAL